MNSSMEKIKVLKTAPSHKVDFELNEEDKTWHITFIYEGCKYYFSKSNTWIVNHENAKSFDFLHNAIHIAKRRGFNYTSCPEFNIVMKDGLMRVIKDDQVVSCFNDIFSIKQASDIVKDHFSVILSKMD